GLAGRAWGLSPACPSLHPSRRFPLAPRPTPPVPPTGYLNRSAGFTPGFQSSVLPLVRNGVGLNSPTIPTSVFAKAGPSVGSGIRSSSPTAQKQPLTIIRRVPSDARSCDAPIVVVNTRP